MTLLYKGKHIAESHSEKIPKLSVTLNGKKNNQVSVVEKAKGFFSFWSSEATHI